MQIDVINSALEAQYLFIHFPRPTGYGKSVIFHALPLCADFLREIETSASREPGRQSPGAFPGSEQSCDNDAVTSSSSIYLLSPPLVSLMRDQVKSLKNRRLQVIYLGDASSQDVSELR